MMDEAQILLRAAGCPKINLQVRPTNAKVIEFYKKIGYKLDARKLAPVMLTLGGIPSLSAKFWKRYHGVGPFLGKAFSIGGKLK